jgi:hypothetical protein
MYAIVNSPMVRETRDYHHCLTTKSLLRLAATGMWLTHRQPSYAAKLPL